MMNAVPSRIAGDEQLEDLLSEPTPAVVDLLQRRPGDIVVLGAAGKMGPSLTRMLRRAADAAGSTRRVIAVSRFTNGDDFFRRHRIETIGCDLLDEASVAHLPEAPNIFYLAGMKFGSTGRESLTWAMNCHLPSIVCRKYRASRIVAFSTGNVYGLTPVAGGGSRESDVAAPVGEYAMSCLGRERIFEHFSRTHDTPVALIRLNYACDLRYGVMVDIARRVSEGEPIDLSMGYFNTIWQGDANAMAIRALDQAAAPPWIVNVTGPELLSVRDVARRLGERMGKPARLEGVEAESAILSNAAAALRTLGPLRVDAEALLPWVADWVMHGGRSLDKPTHFESRDGRF